MKEKLKREIATMLKAIIERYDEDYHWVTGPHQTMRMIYKENKDDPQCTKRMRTLLGVQLRHGALDDPNFLRQWLKKNHRIVWHELQVVAWREDEDWFRVYWRAWLVSLLNELQQERAIFDTYEINRNGWPRP